MSSRMDRHKPTDKDLFSKDAYRKSTAKHSINHSEEDSWKNVRRFDHSQQEQDQPQVNETEAIAKNPLDKNQIETPTYYYEQRKSNHKAPESKKTVVSSESRREFHQNRSPENNKGNLEIPSTIETLAEEKLTPDTVAISSESKQKKRKKKRLGCGCLTWILLILLIISGYCIGFFIKGQNDAKKENQTVKSEVFHGEKSASGAKNILLIGNDSRDGENSRADTIMVLSFEGKKKTPKIISIMRDSYVNIPGHSATKINAAYSYGSLDGTGGAELLRKTIKKSLALPLQYYVTVDFHAFEKVINALYPDGVEINAEKDLDLDGVFIKKGPQVMNGHTLLQYARFRHDPEGDFGRIRRQQQVMTAVFAKLKSPASILRFPYAAGKAMGYTSNNIPLSYYAKIGYGMLKGSRDLKRQSIPVEKTWDFGYTPNGESVIFFDDEQNAKAVQSFLEK